MHSQASPLWIGYDFTQLHTNSFQIMKPIVYWLSLTKNTHIIDTTV